MRRVTRINILALAAALGVLASAYLVISDQRMSDARHAAFVAYGACEEGQPSIVCEAQAEALFETAIRHRRVKVIALIGLILTVALVALLLVRRLLFRRRAPGKVPNPQRAR